MYAQDTWNVRSDFTITYGLRWQFHEPLTEVNGFEAVENRTVPRDFQRETGKCCRRHRRTECGADHFLQFGRLGE